MFQNNIESENNLMAAQSLIDWALIADSSKKKKVLQVDEKKSFLTWNKYPKVLNIPRGEIDCFMIVQ